MKDTTKQRPGEAWLDRMIAEEPTAAEAIPAGTVYQPHDGKTSDMNLHYADMLAGPDESHPDPMAGYEPPVNEGS